MGGRGLLTVACLVLIALSCISVVRKLEHERRLLRKLRTHRALGPESALSLGGLTPEERECARTLQAAGVLAIDRGTCYLQVGKLSPFRQKRLRLALSGGLGALVLAALVAALLLRA